MKKRESGKSSPHPTRSEERGSVLDDEPSLMEGVESTVKTADRDRAMEILPSSNNERKCKVVTDSRKARKRRDEIFYVSPLDRNIWVFFGGLAVILLASIITRFHNISLPKHIA